MRILFSVPITSSSSYHLHLTIDGIMVRTIGGSHLQLVSIQAGVESLGTYNYAFEYRIL